MLDFAKLDPLQRIGLQHASDQILAVGRNLDGHSIVTLLDFHEENGQLFIVKRQTPADHSVENDATRPNVHLLTRVGLARDDLWCSVVG